MLQVVYSLFCLLHDFFPAVIPPQVLFEYTPGGAVIPSSSPLPSQQNNGHLRVCSCREKSQKPLGAGLSYDEEAGQPCAADLYIPESVSQPS